MKRNEIVSELNTLRLVLYDLIGESDIGEHYLNVLNKTISIVGNDKWEYTTDYFNIKCDEIAGDINIDVYYKDTKIDEHSYEVERLISDEASGEA